MDKKDKILNMNPGRRSRIKAWVSGNAGLLRCVDCGQYYRDLHGKDICLDCSMNYSDMGCKARGCPVGNQAYGMRLVYGFNMRDMD